jgi:hypothetical protein
VAGLRKGASADLGLGVLHLAVVPQVQSYFLSGLTVKAVLDFVSLL